MIIKCKICGLVLTNNLEELDNSELINENDNEDYIPKGYYCLSDGAFYRNSQDKIIINIADLINSKNHTNLKRLNGCCGLDGLDGVNKACTKEHEIGTEFSDCWIPHCFIFENELVVVEK